MERQLTFVRSRKPRSVLIAICLIVMSTGLEDDSVMNTSKFCTFQRITLAFSLNASQVRFGSLVL